jgi:hypothetical protein
VGRSDRASLHDESLPHSSPHDPTMNHFDGRLTNHGPTKKTEVPRVALMTALEERTGKRLVRSDWIKAGDPEPDKEALTELLDVRLHATCVQHRPGGCRTAACGGHGPSPTLCAARMNFLRLSSTFDRAAARLRSPSYSRRHVQSSRAVAGARTRHRDAARSVIQEL